MNEERLAPKFSELLSVQKDKLTLVQNSLKITTEMCKLLEEEQYERCQELLGRRQLLFNSIDELNHRIIDIENDLRSLMGQDSFNLEDFRTMTDFAETEQIVKTIISCLRAMSELNTKFEDDIDTRKNTLLSDLSKLENSKRIREHYNPGKSFRTPRFIDKRK